eukprot:TRINITY_DN3939_c0_g1_i1.p1 TRINITY_DN3939_c0_g1~~TRINITY_DN3939_c0_g1_i1.p1  ORF type:complete len:775 (+),score=174.70 TRINITY_DN3939_c0_g1_i1:2607-4931(+)
MDAARRRIWICPLGPVAQRRRRGRGVDGCDASYAILRPSILQCICLSRAVYVFCVCVYLCSSTASLSLQRRGPAVRRPPPLPHMATTPPAPMYADPNTESVVYTFANPPTFQSGSPRRAFSRSPRAEEKSPGPADLPHPVKLLPVSEELVAPSPVLVCRLVHRSSGMWVKCPTTRLRTKITFTPEYADATDLYVCPHEIGGVKGFCLQNPYDGRTLSSDSHCRTWSVSPPRSRGVRGAAGDPTLEMTELHLFLRRAGTAELLQLTEYNELEFVANGRFVAAPCLRHTIHAAVGAGSPGYAPQVGENGDDDDGLWLTSERGHAAAFDLFVSKAAGWRYCRHSGRWYEAAKMVRCDAPGSDGLHESYLLSPWADRDAEERDASYRRERGEPAAPAGLTDVSDSIMQNVLSFLDAPASREALEVNKKWLDLTRAVTGCTENGDLAVVKCLSTVSQACFEHLTATGTPPSPSKLAYRGSASPAATAAAQRQAMVLRHAAHVAVPDLAAAIYQPSSDAPWHATPSPARPSSRRGSSSSRRDAPPSMISDPGSQRLRASTPEGVCIVALVARKVKECLVANNLPSEADVVHMVSSLVSRSLSVHAMVAALDNPAKLYPSVYNALSTAGLLLRSEALQSLASSRYGGDCEGDSRLSFTPPRAAVSYAVCTPPAPGLPGPEPTASASASSAQDVPVAADAASASAASTQEVVAADAAAAPSGETLRQASVGEEAPAAGAADSTPAVSVQSSSGVHAAPTGSSSVLGRPPASGGDSDSGLAVA